MFLLTVVVTAGVGIAIVIGIAGVEEQGSIAAAGSTIDEDVPPPLLILGDEATITAAPSY